MKRARTHAETPGGPAPDLHRAYQLMRDRFGHQRWWPGETRFEICVGAILVQNTAWTGVERALANLKAVVALEPRSLLDLPRPVLEQAIRPAGCFRVKADRLHAYLRVLVHEYDGSLDRLFAGQRDQVRTRLLGIRGIGPETADCLLLYAGGHPSFVVDAYAWRIFGRHGWFGVATHPIPGLPAARETLRKQCMRALALDSPEQEVELWGDYHAQLVAVGKAHCRPRDPGAPPAPSNRCCPTRIADPPPGCPRRALPA